MWPHLILLNLYRTKQQNWQTVVYQALWEKQLVPGVEQPWNNEPSVLRTISTASSAFPQVALTHWSGSSMTPGSLLDKEATSGALCQIPNLKEQLHKIPKWYMQATLKYQVFRLKEHSCLVGNKESRDETIKEQVVPICHNEPEIYLLIFLQ